jgi:Fic family protein
MLERCGYLAGFAVTLAHPFEDGNGRTARGIAEFIINGYDGTDGSKLDFGTLAYNRERSGKYKIFSFVPQVDWANERPEDFLDLVAAQEMAFDTRAYNEHVRDRQFTTPYA